MERFVKELRDRVLSGGASTTREEGLRLSTAPLEELCSSADAIRRHFCGDGFDLCSIVNAKSGRCSEDCKFCAQSGHYMTEVTEYPLLSVDELVESARRDASKGVLRFSFVTSGRKLTESDVSTLCEASRRVRSEVGVEVCGSLGLLSSDDYAALKASGMGRIHNNLETSRRFFPSICTTHTYDEKLAALRRAHEAGMSLCSGGIFGLGESWEDRVDMALDLRELGVRSVPINILNAVPGTPIASSGIAKLTESDARRIVAVYRFLLPDASIRLAGGRGLLEDKGFRCFVSGANATITGDMLTTSGVAILTDVTGVRELGYTPRLADA